MTYVSRGNFGQITGSLPAWVNLLMHELDGSAWSTGIQDVGSRRKGGFHAINADCYGYDEAQQLAIVQVREAYKRKASHFLQLRKNYFLIGRNESGAAFAHAIDSIARTAGLSNDAETPVRAALCKIWHCTSNQLDRIIRNGDTAFIPERKPAKIPALPDATTITLAESHTARGQFFLMGDRLYALGAAEIIHEKGQHPRAVVASGWHRVQVGYRAKIWNFALETHD